MRLAFAAVSLCVAMIATIAAKDLSRGEDRIGLPAPPLALKQWLHSQPVELDELRGKVVLIRWWTEGCPFCAATAPALREFDRKFAGRGLQVIGVFHPKPPGDWSIERMRTASQRLGFSFPVALDAEWTALNRWWSDPEQRGWTSVSFLVDRRGIIRYVHPGGEFHESRDGSHAGCDRSYKQIEQLIGNLLAEPR
jgi:peroxiredoxin